MAVRARLWPFVLLNAVVWCVMTAILVVVPDTLQRWTSIEIARVIGWAIACGVWVIAVESQWKARYGPVTRFAVQLVLWVSAALLAMWISDLFRVEIP